MPKARKRHSRWYERDYTPTDPRLWLYGPVPPGFWQATENRRLYMDWLGERLGFTHVEDWYHLSLQDFRRWRGLGLLRRFNDSPLAMLKEYRPDYQWLEWRFRNVPLRFWQSRSNRRRYLNWLGEQLGFTTKEAWYRLSAHDLKQHHGTRLLRMFGGSPCAIVKDAFPQYRWLEWRFPQVPAHFWEERANRRRYMHWLKKRLRIRRLQDWYKLSKHHFIRWDGGGLLAWFDDSPTAVLKDYLPQHEWLEWRFPQVPSHFWEERPNCERYLEWLGQQLGFQCLEDWYKISYDDLMRSYGARLLTKCGDSSIAVVKAYKPDYDWKEWLFARPPRRFWAQPQNRWRYLDWLGQQLGFTQPGDWVRVRRVDINRHRGQGLLKHYRSPLPRIVHEYLTTRGKGGAGPISAKVSFPI